jgi:hypothetical protein
MKKLLHPGNGSFIAPEDTLLAAVRMALYCYPGIFNKKSLFENALTAHRIAEIERFWALVITGMFFITTEENIVG